MAEVTASFFLFPQLNDGKYDDLEPNEYKELREIRQHPCLGSWWESKMTSDS